MAEFSSYNIASININNITNATKLEALRTLTRTHDLDIVFLQEVENEQLSLPGFNVVCNVDQARRGTAIALKDHIQFSHVEKSLDGRLIALRIRDITLVNVYAPSGTALRAERERFFNGTIAYYLRYNTQHVILAGDFNCVLRQSDSTGANSSPALQATIRQLQLHDVWLKLYPTIPAPTYVTHNAASRLDRMYISTGLCEHLRTAATHVCSFTDHKALTARICLPHLGRAQGRGFWSLRPHLLKTLTSSKSGGSFGLANGEIFPVGWHGGFHVRSQKLNPSSGGNQAKHSASSTQNTNVSTRSYESRMMVITRIPPCW